MANIKVLYVEDEPFLGRIVKDSLESRQLIVKMVDDGGNALSAFEEFKPDICVLDIMLPNKDGYTIAREIRQRQEHIPIIFLTAKTQTEDLLKGFEVGGNDFLRKPFSMEELIARIQSLLKLSNKMSQAPKEAIRLGQYEFWIHRYELRKGDHVRKLSYREASLLQMLAESSNSTILRKDILLKLWGDDSYFNSRNLDVYITKLREYIKEESQVQIITIKGVGYLFSTE